MPDTNLRWDDQEAFVVVTDNLNSNVSSKERSVASLGLPSLERARYIASRVSPKLMGFLYVSLPCRFLAAQQEDDDCLAIPAEVDPIP